MDPTTAQTFLTTAQTFFEYGHLCHVQAQAAGVGALWATEPACQQLGQLVGRYAVQARPTDVVQMLVFFILMASIPR
jgi:hypothetical protein